MEIVLFPIIVRLQSDSNDNDDIEQIDEDIAVTQSQMNFICPITQVCYHAVRDWERAISCPSLGCLLQIPSTC